MRYLSKMMLWFVVANAIGVGVHPVFGSQKNFVEVFNSLVKHYERVFLRDNETPPREEAVVEDFVVNEPVIQEPAEMDAFDQRLHLMRLEHIQNQILRKLRLPEKPKPSAKVRSSLPLPVQKGETMLYGMHEPEEDERHSVDFYGMTDQKVVFPNEVKNLGKCEGRRAHPTSCVTFTMPVDLQPHDVSSMDLWIYKKKDKLDDYNQTLLVSDADHWDYNRLFRKTRPMSIFQTHVHEGWIKIEVGWIVKEWLEKSVAILEVSCLSCGENHMPIGLSANQRPFLVFNTKYNSKSRRVRYLECSKGMSDCCRERLYVSFAEIGWQDWILQPEGFYANFCRGSCNSVSSVTLVGSYHQSVMKKLFHSNNSRRMEFKSCCTPVSFSSLQLLYLDSNNTVTQKTLPNIIVKSCGCM